MIRGGNVAIDVEKTRAELKRAGFQSLSAFERSVGMAHAQVFHVLKAGSCRAETLARIEAGLSLEPGALKAGEESENMPRYYRQLRGLSVNQLSEMSGISSAIIHRLERGGGDCYAFSAACLAKALGVPMGVYLGYED